ncbi:MAG: calcium-binding protein [Deltaproteobacteria bacterium]|nr:calcium-binding protein [Deltaproteobacteria bacterium]
MEIIVDAYGPEEQAMGWYYYLEEKLKFPFTAVCSAKRAISPLQLREEVKVLKMAPEEECEKEMFVTIRRGRGRLAVPLSQLGVGNEADEQTRQAVEDWPMFSWRRPGPWMKLLQYCCRALCGNKKGARKPLILFGSGGWI